MAETAEGNEESKGANQEMKEQTTTRPVFRFSVKELF